VNEVYNNSLKEFICNLILTISLRSQNVAVLEYCNGGVPVRFPSSDSLPDKDFEAGFFKKSVNFIKRASTLREISKTILIVLFQRLGSLIATATTHRLVAGDDYLSIANVKFRAKKRIKLVLGHSEDYSNNLLEMSKSIEFVSPYSRIATYIDGPGPMFTGDVVYFSRKVHFTSDIWYPALSRFFDRIEAESGVRIIIAGHYKSKHPHIAPYFGNRQVFYGLVRELVMNSEFVLTRISTAISYAVIFRKPVISIYSDQLKSDLTMMHDIRGMASVLGNTPININDPAQDLNGLLTVKEDRYKYYEKACLTSTISTRPNCQIIMEDVLNIKHVVII
jgi:hypothetical protein